MATTSLRPKAPLSGSSWPTMTLLSRDRYRDALVTGMALNHLGTADPPPLARVALRAYLDFHQTALDEWRNTDLDLDTLLALLEQTLTATVAAIRAA